ncbi:isochorismatase family protein [Micromonospora sp. DR5-3]|uniref:isochorismatase family protein n=1 Tax=unclassified Micromonospora TaxID=2617518 RepID=UPI0011DB4248|nr:MULTISPECIES: isochorismatase family protein [unclassified Micromonospora]MCW3813243.1 isochorismatase family protein [Micromonospora sp. DR5-3]TYC24636.1 isochorismatase family protein [Micromonospora sp. MP36]
MDALDPRRTAVVLIDLQRRIVDLPTAPHTGPEVVDRCVALAEAARAAGATVVVVRVDRPGPDPQPAGSELLAEVAPRDGDVSVVKHSWGAFHETGLDEALRARGVDTLVIGGLVTNFGVEQTARIGDEIGYRVVLPHDAMSGLDGYAHEFAVDYVFRRLGTVCTTEEAIAALRG